MKLDRLAYEPAALADFYEEGFSQLGALCERTWHDRLEVVAEGPAAKLWNPDGALHAIELTFASADAASARDAGREVFPACPLTFRLSEALQRLIFTSHSLPWRAARSRRLTSIGLFTG